MAKPPSSHGRAGRGFIERNVSALAETLSYAAAAEEVARQAGWLQKLDPRSKLIGIGVLILATVSARHLTVVLAVWLAGILFAYTSRLPLRGMMVRTWVGVLAFTGVIALPSIFLTPGRPFPLLPGWSLSVTTQGLHTAGLLLTRAETTATLALMLVLSTRWTQLLKALRVLRVPAVLIVILGMTQRYIFLLLHLATDFFTARRSRLVGTLDARQRRQVAAGAVGVLLDRSLQLSGEVHQAMLSRGFRGEALALDDFRWRWRDSTALGFFTGVAAVTLWFGLR